MDKLTRSARNALMNYLLKGIAQNQTLKDDGLCAYSSSSMTPKEILMRKYRMLNCIKCLVRMGRMDLAKDLELPDIDFVVSAMEIPEMELEYDDDWQCQLMETLATLNEFGEMYLTKCLENTGWKVTLIAELEFYDELEVEVVKKCKESIEFHWDAINELMDDECQSDYLSSLGIEAYGYYSFYPDCNVILTNDTIREMLSICEKDKYFQNWDEYKEFRKFWEFTLFDRYYPEVSNPDFSKSGWVCLNYLLGEVCHDRVEETGFYQLNYETVICLMLADMVAEEFMERYQVEKEGMVESDERKAS